MRFASAPRRLVRDGRSARSSDPTPVPTSASPEVVLRILDRIGRRRVDAECLCPSGGSPHSPLGRSAQDEERVRGTRLAQGGSNPPLPLEDLDGDQPAYSRLRGGELVAGSGSLDGASHEPAPPEGEGWKHVLAGVAPNLGVRSGSVVRRPLGQTPDPGFHRSDIFTLSALSSSPRTSLDGNRPVHPGTRYLAWVGTNEARCSRRVRYAVGHDLAARDAERGHRRG